MHATRAGWPARALVVLLLVGSLQVAGVAPAGATPVAPIAGHDSYTTPKNTELCVDGRGETSTISGCLGADGVHGLLANDILPSSSGGTLKVAFPRSTPDSGFTVPRHGSLKAINTLGLFWYVPDPGFVGTDTFTYRAWEWKPQCDADWDGLPHPDYDPSQCPLSNTATVTIEVVNRPPIAAADTYQGVQDAELDVGAPGVLGNDHDPDGDRIMVGQRSSPGNGSLTLRTDGSFTYTPDPGFTGTDSFTYRAEDRSDGSLSEPATVTIRVRRAAAAVDDPFYVTPVDTQLTVSAPGVLTNDESGDSCVTASDLTAQLRTEPTHGAARLASDGSFTYTPETGFRGGDSFTYRVRCGDEPWSVEARTTITVRNRPTAVDDSYSVVQGETLVVPPPGLLENDTAPDDDCVLRVRFDEDPEHGNLRSDGRTDGRFSYTPEPGFTGTDQFNYYALCEGSTIASREAIATIRVNPANRPPTATDDAFTTRRNITLTVGPPGVLANDTDPDADDLTAVLASPPDTGAVTLAPDGSFDYAPGSGFAGVVTFTYRAKDPSGSLSAPATVRIEVPATVTTTTLSSSANPSVYGEDVVFSATVAADGDTATGVAAFTIDGAAVTGCSAVPLAGARATCSTSLDPGTHEVTVRFDGTSDGFAPSSATLTQVVERAQTTLSAGPMVVRVIPLRLLEGPSAVLHSDGSPLAGRALQFTAAGQPLCRATTGPDGSAGCELTLTMIRRALVAGGYEVHFAGDATHHPSTASGGLISLR